MTPSTPPKMTASLTQRNFRCESLPSAFHRGGPPKDLQKNYDDDVTPHDPAGQLDDDTATPRRSCRAATWAVATNSPLTLSTSASAPKGPKDELRRVESTVTRFPELNAFRSSSPSRARISSSTTRSSTASSPHLHSRTARMDSLPPLAPSTSGIATVVPSGTAYPGKESVRFLTADEIPPLLLQQSQSAPLKSLVSFGTSTPPAYRSTGTVKSSGSGLVPQPVPRSSTAGAAVKFPPMPAARTIATGQAFPSGCLRTPPPPVSPEKQWQSVGASILEWQPARAAPNQPSAPRGRVHELSNSERRQRSQPPPQGGRLPPVVSQQVGNGLSVNATISLPQKFHHPPHMRGRQQQFNPPHNSDPLSKLRVRFHSMGSAAGSVPTKQTTLPSIPRGLSSNFAERPSNGSMMRQNLMVAHSHRNELPHQVPIVSQSSFSAAQRAR